MLASMSVKVMAFPDFPFRDDLPSFVGHEDVRNYLNDYAQHFGLVPFIKARISALYTVSQKTDFNKKFRMHILEGTLNKTVQNFPLFKNICKHYLEKIEVTN